MLKQSKLTQQKYKHKREGGLGFHWSLYSEVIVLT
jgi:hypothetical protein